MAYDVCRARACRSEETFAARRAEGTGRRVWTILMYPVKRAGRRSRHGRRRRHAWALAMVQKAVCELFVR